MNQETRNVQDEERHSGGDPRQGGRAAQRAAGRLHRPSDADQAGALERQGTELHRPARAVRQINEEVEDYVDDIAERAVQLGGVAEGTARMAAKRSSLAEYPAKAVDGRSHVEALSSALAAFGKAARKAIDTANEIGDLDTADLFTEISRGTDKWLWFVEAHLQAER